MHDRTYEPHVSAIIARLCKPGMTALDIGANIGYHTMLLAHHVGRGGRVLAFEANSENARLILATVRTNGATNVEVLPVALDTARGWACFTSHVGSNGGLLRETPFELIGGGRLYRPFRSTSW